VAHILIVDDEPSERLLQQRILERHGHTVYTAPDGVEALLNLRLKDIDLVITDLQMPDIHGLELISVLRDQSPRPTVVVVSGTGPDQLAIARRRAHTALEDDRIPSQLRSVLAQNPPRSRAGPGRRGGSADAWERAHVQGVASAAPHDARKKGREAREVVAAF